MQPKFYTIFLWEKTQHPDPYWTMCYNGRYPICLEVLAEAEKRLKELQDAWPNEVYKIFEMKELE